MKERRNEQGKRTEKKVTGRGFDETSKKEQRL